MSYDQAPSNNKRIARLEYYWAQDRRMSPLLPSDAPVNYTPGLPRLRSYVENNKIHAPEGVHSKLHVPDRDRTMADLTVPRLKPLANHSYLKASEFIAKAEILVGDAYEDLVLFSNSCSNNSSEVDFQLLMNWMLTTVSDGSPIGLGDIILVPQTELTRFKEELIDELERHYGSCKERYERIGVGKIKSLENEVYHLKARNEELLRINRRFVADQTAKKVISRHGTVHLRGGAGMEADPETAKDCGTAHRLQQFKRRYVDSDDEDEIGPVQPSGWAKGADTDARRRDRDLPTSSSASSVSSSSSSAYSWTSGSTIRPHFKFLCGTHDGPKDTQERDSPQTQAIQAVFPSRQVILPSNPEENLISSQFLTPQELWAAQPHGTAMQAQLAGDGYDDIAVQQTWVPRGDRRLANVDDQGHYLGGLHEQPKKRFQKGLRENVQELNHEINAAQKLYAQFLSMSLDDRAEVLRAITQPLKLWEDTPGAAPDDVEDTEDLPDPSIHPTNATSRQFCEDDFRVGEFDDPNLEATRSHRNRDKHRVQAVLSGLVTHPRSNQQSRNSQATATPDIHTRPRSQSRFNSSRSDLRRQSNQRHGHTNRLPPRTFGVNQSSTSTSIPDRRGNRSHQSLSAAGPNSIIDTGTIEYNRFLSSLEDAPELARVHDSPSVVDLLNRGSELLLQATKNSSTYGRILQVQLHGLVHFTPNAIMSRVCGGIIQELQLFPVLRVALVILLHPAEARACVKHFKNIRENGDDHDRREPQIELDWYRGKEALSILPISPNLMSQHIQNGATRVLRLQRIDHETTKEQLADNLGRALQVILIKVVLVAPQQNYLKQIYGRQAMVHFVSINDALVAKEKFETGLAEGFDDCAPSFAPDPSAEPYKLMAHCTCLGCKERLYQKAALAA